jgi:alpha-1,3-rhamnosyl/mannosyltransferase
VPATQTQAPVTRLDPVDVTLIVDSLGPTLTGIGRYTWELCKAVPGQPGIGNVGFFSQGVLEFDPAVFLDGKPAPHRGRLQRWFAERRVSRKLRDTVVHGPNYFLPADAETGIITVHDLSVYRFPETHPLDRRQAFEREFERSLGRACHVVADSETVRREVIADFGVPESRISAIPLGVDSRFHQRPADELRRQLAELGLQPGSYALCVSTLEPRKKIAELIGAWSRLAAADREATPLVLAGAKGWLNETLHHSIREAAAEGWLKHLGFVPESALAALYAGARLFLYPSIYEGFGLPPLEAMASGTPVLVADRSCLPEVCGDAAGYVDPDDTEAFTAAIDSALTDSQWRESAREKGLRRASMFRWQSCVARTAELYRTHWRGGGM